MERIPKYKSAQKVDPGIFFLPPLERFERKKLQGISRDLYLVKTAFSAMLVDYFDKDGICQSTI